jgi:TRAP-type C4-dicarboxylate transport system substrate-binding protein
MAGLALLLIATSSIANALTLKVATLAPDGTSWMKHMRKGAMEIDKLTDGRVHIKFYPGGVMGNSSTMLKKMRVGQLHGGAFTGASLAEVYPDAQLYSMPLVFHSYDEVKYVRQWMDNILIRGLRRKGFETLGISDGGFAYIMCTKPLRKLEDLQGQKVWVPEGDVLSEAMFEAAGVTPISLPVADVYTGLQTGLLDTVAGIPTGIIAFQWYTKATHFTDVPLMFLTGMLVLDSKAFRRIKPADQETVRKVMARIFKELDHINRDDNESARMALKSQGIEFIYPNKTEMRSWEAVAIKSRNTTASRAKYTPELVDEMLGHIRKFRADNGR